LIQEEPDLAVLRVVGTPPDIRALKINPNPVRRNSRVRVIGHLYNVAEGWTSTTGEVINFAPNNPKLPIDESMAEENSGEPVINDQDDTNFL
jgi:S1-C subfamily serine protease